MDFQLHKFPSTPHLAWLGSNDLRGDKILTAEEAEEFLSTELVIEEKVDGANLGISRDTNGQLQFQNRGNYLTGQLTGQWKPLRGWASDHYNSFSEYLPAGLTLFGEWCYAKHSIFYRTLPDFFLVFDCYDHNYDQFWSTLRRDALCEKLGLFHVPLLQKSRITIEEAKQLALGKSMLTDRQREGIYLRRETQDILEYRAKIVSPTFHAAIEHHWSKKSLEPNLVSYGNSIP